MAACLKLYLMNIVQQRDNDMSALPRFSIVVPVYNTSKFLNECLRSVESQSYADYELILVDDGSTDSSGQLCDEFKESHQNTRVIHQENKGLLLARRVGLKAAVGEYIVTLDSDDTLRSDMLAIIATEIDSHAPDIVVFNYSRSKNFMTYGPSRLDIDPGYYCSQQYDLLKKEIAGGRHNNLWGKCYRRSLADVEADYTSFQGLTHVEDLLQLLPIIDACQSFSYLDAALYFYRPNPSSATKSYRAQQLTDLSVALDALIKYASQWGSDFLWMAHKGALLQVSFLLHMLVAAQPSKETLQKQIAEIYVYAKKASLFGPWEHELRLDKRLEIQALECNKWQSVVRRVRIFELFKRARDLSAQ